MSCSNDCFLTCIQVSQEADQVVWYAHLLQNFPQLIEIHTVKGLGLQRVSVLVCLRACGTVEFSLACMCFTLLCQFCLAAKWTNCTCTYIPSSLEFLPTPISTERWAKLPVRTVGSPSLPPLFTESVVFTDVSPSLPDPLNPRLPLGVHMFVLSACDPASVLELGSSVPLFYS